MGLSYSAIMSPTAFQSPFPRPRPVRRTLLSSSPPDSAPFEEVILVSTCAESTPLSPDPDQDSLLALACARLDANYTRDSHLLRNLLATHPLFADELTLRAPQVLSDPALRVRNATGIRSLTFATNATPYTHACLADNVLPSLRNTLAHLSFCACLELSDAHLASIAQLTALRELSLDGCVHISDDGLRSVARLGPTLRVLSLAGCKKVTHVRLLAALTSLQALSLERCPRIQDSDLAAVLRSMQKLHSLNVAHCFRVTSNAFLDGWHFSVSPPHLHTPQVTPQSTASGQQDDRYLTFQHLQHGSLGTAAAAAATVGSDAVAAAAAVATAAASAASAAATAAATAAAGLAMPSSPRATNGTPFARAWSTNPQDSHTMLPSSSTSTTPSAPSPQRHLHAFLRQQARAAPVQRSQNDSHGDSFVDAGQPAASIESSARVTAPPRAASPASALRTSRTIPENAATVIENNVARPGNEPGTGGLRDIAVDTVENDSTHVGDEDEQQGCDIIGSTPEGEHSLSPRNDTGFNTAQTQVLTQPGFPFSGGRVSFDTREILCVPCSPSTAARKSRQFGRSPPTPTCQHGNSQAALDRFVSLDVRCTQVDNKFWRVLKQMRRLQMLLLGGTGLCDPAEDDQSSSSVGGAEETIIELERTDGNEWETDSGATTPRSSVGSHGSCGIVSTTRHKRRQPGADVLTNMRNLRQLGIERTMLGDGVLAAVHELPHLETLNLAYTQVTNMGIGRYVSKMTCLQWLSVEETAIGDYALERLSNLTLLRHFDLSDTGVSNFGVQVLSSLTRLRSVDLSFTKVTNRGLKILGSLQALESLSLDGERITDEGLAQIGQLPNLTELEISSARITDTGLLDFARAPAMRSMVSLDLCSCVRIGDVSIKHGLTRMHALEELNLSQTGVTDAGVVALLASLPRISLLNVSHTDVTDISVEAAQIHKTLRRLNVQGCSLRNPPSPPSSVPPSAVRTRELRIVF